jgi:hypothetical protein
MSVSVVEKHRLAGDVRLLERYEAVREDRRQGKVCFQPLTFPLTSANIGGHRVKLR